MKKPIQHLCLVQIITSHYWRCDAGGLPTLGRCDFYEPGKRKSNPERCKYFVHNSCVNMDARKLTMPSGEEK